MSSSGTITSLEQLEQRLELKSEERAWKEEGLSLPLAITEYYFNLINPDDCNDPIRRQVVPSVYENERLTHESDDPLAERMFAVTERLVHRYPSRAAFLTTDKCATYCRHCFRRRFSGGSSGRASDEEIHSAATYLATQSQIKELLLTGGDPLLLSTGELDQMIAMFRSQRSDLVLRICSRVPVTWPSRIDAQLIAMLKKHATAPFYLITQFNHPREITAESKKAIDLFVEAGIMVLNQSVLLKGVNNDLETLVALMENLVSIRVKPYYLFQGDLVWGTSHFRTTIAEGLDLVRALRRRVSHLAMPQYAVDLPHAGGKVPLQEQYLKELHPDGKSIFETLEGETRIYQ